MTLFIVLFISLFLLILVTGVFWGPWVSLHRTIDVFSLAEFIHIAQTMVVNLATLMRVLMPACLLFLLASCFLYPQVPSGGFYLTAAALVLSIGSLLITMIVEVPIVTRIRHWTVETAPADWRALRDRWRYYHVIRLATSLLSLACYMAAIFLLTVSPS